MSVKFFLKQMFLILSSIRLIPHIFFLYWHHSSKSSQIDVIRWSSIVLEDKTASPYGIARNFVQLMTFYPEYRNLFYFRLGGASKLISLFCSSMDTLYIETRVIGDGLFIQHGFSTMIAAKIIGKNCWINQQVTIGFSNNTDCPSIGDNVTINAGAKVIGNIHIGKNVIIGANAVVVKDVPDNCVVVGVPAYIIRRDGIKIKKSL